VIQGVSGPLRLGTNQAWTRFRHAAFFLHLLKRHHDYQEGQENGERGVQRVPGEGAGDGTDGHYVFGREEGVPKIPLQVLAQVLEVKGIQVVTPTLDTLPDTRLTHHLVSSAGCGPRMSNQWGGPMCPMCWVSTQTTLLRFQKLFVVWSQKKEFWGAADFAFPLFY
jgi:hypothetical protein